MRDSGVDHKEGAGAGGEPGSLEPDPPPPPTPPIITIKDDNTRLCGTRGIVCFIFALSGIIISVGV